MTNEYDIMYKHVNGTWISKYGYTDADLEEAKKSDFVEELVIVKKNGVEIVKPEVVARIIKEICNKQYREHGGVLPPEYCLRCHGCPIGAIVKTIGGN